LEKKQAIHIMNSHVRYIGREEKNLRGELRITGSGSRREVTSISESHVGNSYIRILTRVSQSVEKVDQISDFSTRFDQVSKSVRECRTRVEMSDTTQKVLKSVSAFIDPRRSLTGHHEDSSRRKKREKQKEKFETS